MAYCPHLRSKVDIEPSGNTLFGVPRALMMEIQVREINSYVSTGLFHES
jgi:hypothetical protein